jgi:putative SOS response-associated peptidase YedK
MCGRFSQGEPSRHVSDYFGAYPDDDLPDGLYNVPPTEAIRMVVNRDGERRLAAARWGFQPFWTEQAAPGTPRSWINALRHPGGGVLRVGSHGAPAAAVRHRTGGARRDARAGRHLE